MQINAKETLEYFKQFHLGYVLAIAVVCLTMIGLVVLSSAGKSFSDDVYFILRRQTIWLGLALLGGLIVVFFDLNSVRRRFWLVGLFVVALLLLVLIPNVGVMVNGARRWLDLGLMRLQVSDLARVAMVLVMAQYLACNQRYIQSFWRGYVFPCAIIGVFCGLIVLQPDYGTAFLCGVVGMSMLFLAGARLIYLIPTVIVGVVGFMVAISHDPVRWRRITAFLYPEENKHDAFYQTWQGILAFGAGGVDGVGLGNGRQQIAYLPEAHTDFIFPIIGEELGFICTATVVLLFILIFGIGVTMLRKAPNIFEFMIVWGSMLFITCQALINMGVVTGLLPNKGMSLPFISYGGSNLVIMFVLIGLILNCFRSWAAPPLRRPREV